MTRPWLLVAALTFSAPILSAATYVVSTTADDGPGSLRQGILDANSGACALPCRIDFASGSGLMRIEPLSPLPALTAARAEIAPAHSWTVELSGAKVSAGDGLLLRCNECVVRAMIVNGFPGSGIAVEGGSATIGANMIGLDATGTRAVPNLRHGVSAAGGNEVAIESNNIGGNGGDGVHVEGVARVALGLNHIGDQYLLHSGNARFPNGGAGIFLRDVASGLMAFNIIVSNAGAGVVVTGQSRVKVQARGYASRIFDNGGLPIDLGADGVTPNGPNGLQNRPVLTVADLSNGFLRVLGEVTAASNTSVDVNVFASDRVGVDGIADAERPVYDAKVVTDANGRAQFEFRFPMPSDVGNWISATATTDLGTSELSAPLQAALSNQNYVVMTTADSGPGSLRQAILDANAGICSADFPCRIEFDLPPPLPAAGYYTIAPLTPLPPITRSGITVDGTSPQGKPREYKLRPARIEISGRFCAPGAGLTIAATTAPVIGASIRNLAINGFYGDGIVIDGGADPLYILNPVINSNLIGTDPTGTAAVANAGAGVRARGVIPFQHFGTYGSGNRFEGNLISGNGSHGVLLESGFFEFEGNAIGADITRRLPLGNGGSGVHVAAGARSHLEGNMMAFNAEAGVSFADPTPAVFNGVIGNAIHSNVGLAIDLSDGTAQAPPEITSAVYDLATGSTTVTGSFVRNSAFPGYLPALDFLVSSFPEAGGRGSGEKTAYNNSIESVKDEGGGRYTFRQTIRTDLRSMRIAATATPFSYQGWKLPPVGTIFGQGFVYGTTSEMSKAIPVVTVGCPSEQPRLIDDLRWTTVAGATSYNVWLRRPGDVRRLAVNTAGDTATVPLPPGRTEWFVEALFPGCPSMMSEAGVLDVPAGRRRPSR